MEIIIDSRLKYNYSSWYLLGLQRVFGKRNIMFDAEPFKQLPYDNMRHLNSGVAFIVQNGTKELKVFVDFEDVAIVFPKRYEWCDVYGMVNPTAEQLAKYDKMIAIGPEFAVTLGSKASTILKCLKNYSNGHHLTSIPFKIYLRDYIYTNIRRRSIDVYDEKVDVKDNYIFHASTLWYNEFAKKYTNYFRGEFLRACSKAGINIEGGLYYIGDRCGVVSEMPDYPKYKEIYKDFIYDKRLSMDDYIRKTKESVMVFNTPAVGGCHGWKLAEYLCMGKAIISTPFLREMPYPMEHGKNIHFVKDAKELYDAVVRINTDATYRHTLERGAREYYEKWIAPEVVIQRLMRGKF